MKFTPFETLIFDHKHCFLTGLETTESIAVFTPELIYRFHLTHTALILSNGAKLNYADLRLPCEENTKAAISKLTLDVEDILLRHPEDLATFETLKLHQYLSLLLYAVMYQDIAQSKLGTQLFQSSEIASRVKLLHTTLRSLIQRVEYQGAAPGSIFTFRSFDYPENTGFDFKTGLNTFTVQLRAGETVLMASLLDFGILGKFYASYFSKMGAHTLHPVQGDELFARLSYKTYLIKQKFELNIEAPEDVENAVTTIGFRAPDTDVENVEDVVFAQWEDEVYAQVMAQYLARWGLQESDLFDPQQGTRTFIDADGEPIIMDAQGEIIA